ncbi:hypothetical protein EDD21DRAFT_390744 [Dissophora ornata]|nr:hypothetical protein BGZ58_010437 [Dissophora ornata]KAI8595617.1 hypothetical protein EDD21DRAFT_390744 [Dissophora ornata]
MKKESSWVKDGSVSPALRICDPLRKDPLVLAKKSDATTNPKSVPILAHIESKGGSDLITTVSDFKAQEECELSPVITTATPIVARSPCSAFSLEWPPANQEAAARLQWPEPTQKGERQSEGLSQAIPQWLGPFSPIHLPSDPEDTSILEPLDAFKEDTLTDKIPIQENGLRSEGYFSEWIRSEDWQAIEEEEEDPSADQKQNQNKDRSKDEAGMQDER